jgi:hypothetical protein
MLRATLNEAVPLQVLAADGKVDLYAKATLYSDGALLSTVDLSHIDGGLYGASYTPSEEGYLSVVYRFFYDAGMTIPADYDLESEAIEVSSDKTNILRILGLLHHNATVDQQDYDDAGNLKFARVRSYKTPDDRLLGGLTGLLFTWLVKASYTGGRVSNFSIEEVP